MRYITQVLELLIAGGHRPVEPRADRAADRHQRSQAEMRKLVWSQPPVKHSYYKNAYGEMHILGPWRLVDYWRWTREPNPYTLEPVQWLLLIWLLVRWIRVRDDRVLVAVGTHALVAVRARPPQLRMAPVVAGEADALYGGRPGIVDSTVLLLRSENQTPPARPRLSLSQRVPAR